MLFWFCNYKCWDMTIYSLEIKFFITKIANDIFRLSYTNFLKRISKYSLIGKKGSISKHHHNQASFYHLGEKNNLCQYWLVWKHHFNGISIGFSCMPVRKIIFWFCVNQNRNLISPKVMCRKGSGKSEINEVTKSINVDFFTIPQLIMIFKIYLL